MIKNILRFIYWNVIRHIQVFLIVYNKYGHRKSFNTKKSINKDGKPIPWYTFPAIEYLNQFDFSNSIVFEYGAGYSTFYWSDKAKEVTSVECDKKWYEIINNHHRDNLHLYLYEGGDEYINSINQHADQYDIIIIDGIYRLSCLEQAVNNHSEDGIIILDNSDWHPDCTQFLRDNRYFEIDFSGLGPINNYCWTTSIFIRHTTKLQNNYKNPMPVGGTAAT